MPGKGDDQDYDNNVPYPFGEGSGEFAVAWVRYVGALRRLLAEPPSERVLDAFLMLRDAALDALEAPGMVANLQTSWASLHGKKETPNPAHLLLLEVLAFPVALDLKDAEEKVSKEPKKSLWKRLLGIGGTVIDSTHDILEDLPWHWKALLKAGKEVVDIFRGE